jgi:hypothetical protein
LPSVPARVDESLDRRQPHLLVFRSAQRAGGAGGVSHRRNLRVEIDGVTGGVAEHRAIGVDALDDRIGEANAIKGNRNVTLCSEVILVKSCRSRSVSGSAGCAGVAAR